MDELYFNSIVTKSLEPINSEDRYFEGYLTVQMKDKQNEITIVDELYKVLPVWMDRGAPISDTHSNRIVGKGINYAKTVYKGDNGEEYPAIKITGKIHKNYELDNDIWNRIKSGEYKGLSFGGATRANRTPVVMKDGSIAYELKDLEHYEVAVCRDPAVPLALITDYNPVAKAIADHTEDRDGKMLIKCSKFGCYVDKRADWDDDVTANRAHAEGTARLADPDNEDMKKLLEGKGFKVREKPCPTCQSGSTIEAKRDNDDKWYPMSGTSHDTGKHICPNCARKQTVRDLATHPMYDKDSNKYKADQDPDPEDTNPESIMARAKVVGRKQDMYKSHEEEDEEEEKEDKKKAGFEVAYQGGMEEEEAQGIRRSKGKKKADLGEYDTFQGKVDALVKEGTPEENAKKIVGAFVKREKANEIKELSMYQKFLTFATKAQSLKTKRL